MKYDTIVVGGGMAGLTATAYMAKDNHSVLLCEMGDEVGGLVSSFPYKGFILDGGIRSIENSGIVLPMLNQLGIEVPFERSIVSLGIEDTVIDITDQEAVNHYRELLIEKFPNDKQDIDSIIKEIKKIMKYMDILYGIDNPLFLDFKEHKEYYMKTIFPWMFKYLVTFPKVNKRRLPVDEYLAKFTKNQALIDVIGQHFFKKTPAFFALSYFSLYLDYNYPKGGTGTLVQKVKEYCLNHNADIKTNTQIVDVDPIKKVITDANGTTYEYEQLIWAADLRSLYKQLDLSGCDKPQSTIKISQRRKELEPMRGGDSVLTSYLFVNRDVNYFKDKHKGHFFYTPIIDGLSNMSTKVEPLEATTFDQVKEWLTEYFKLNTFEISVPAIRDRSLAPEGKTALIVSLLMDYDIVQYIADQGWYEQFKNTVADLFIDVLNESIYPGFKADVYETFGSTPLTIKHRTNSTDGAITGWAFTNSHMPAVESLPLIASSVKTPIPDVHQAGQWTYSPAGLPISILTGKLASDRAKKILKKRKKSV